MGQGIYHYFGYDLSFEERTEAISKAGFESTMLWWGDEDFIPLSKAEQIASVRLAGLVVENVHAPYAHIWKLWSKERKTAAEAQQEYCRYIDECERYQIPMMVIHGMPQEPIEDDYQGFESFAALLAHAKAAGVILAVENTIEDPRFDHLLKALIPEGLKWCYDSSHDWIYSQFPTRLITEYGEGLACLHLSDNDGQFDRHWLPGKGLVSFQRIQQILKEQGFEGQWSLEVFPQESKGAANEFLTEARNRLTWVMEGAGHETEL